MPKKCKNHFPDNIQELSEELQELKRLLRQHTAGECEQPLALTRIYSGISQEQWSELARENGLTDWLALSLEESATENIRYLQHSLNELSDLTDQDPLTGLANRRSFERKLEVELQRVERSNGQVSLGIIDLDHFKNVNDTHGHPCGDDVLIKLASTLNTSRRAYDVAARMGGEEFALILPGASPLKAKAVIERLLQEFSAITFSCGDGEPFKCTFSAGIASLKGRNNSNAETLVQLADKALYEAKNHGRNRVHVARQMIEQEIDRTSMVQSSEKQFLFSAPE